MNSEDSRRRALIDSSSAILLYKVDLLDRMMDVYRLVISREVMNELTVPSRAGAEQFARIIGTGKLEVSHDYRGCLLNLPLLGGEREIIQLFMSGQGEFVIIDDGEGAAYCSRNSIPYINALLVPKILFLSGALDEGTAGAASRRLLAEGRYSAGIKEYAHSCASETLARFLP